MHVRARGSLLHTSVTLPTTTSPTSGLYLVRSGRTLMSLLTISTTPATDATSASSSAYVPCPRMNPLSDVIVSAGVTICARPSGGMTSFLEGNLMSIFMMYIWKMNNYC
jgi:hypothetical protein